MKFKSWFGFGIAVFSILFLGGCSDPVSSIKDGILDLNKSTTLGKALDGWGACGSTKWSHAKSQSGQITVLFACEHQGVGKFISDLQNKVINRNADALAGMQGNPTFAIKLIDTKHVNSLKLSNATTLIEFQINKDGSFETKSIKINLLWSDGVKHIVEDAINIENYLSMIYENKSKWEVGSGYPIALVGAAEYNAKISKSNPTIEGITAFSIQVYYLEGKGINLQSEMFNLIGNNITK